MNVRILIRKLQRNIEDYGVVTTAKRSLFYLIKPVYEHTVCRIYSIDLNSIHVHHMKLDNDRFKFISKNDLNLIMQIEKMEEWLYGKLKAKLEKNSICVAVLDKEKVIGFNLISFGEVYIPLLKLRMALKDDEAWSEQISIHKDYRRMHLGSDLRYCVFEELKKKKFKTLYGSVLISNESSLKMAHKLGFKNLMDIHFTRYLIFKTWQYIKLNVLSHLDGQSFYQ